MGSLSKASQNGVENLQNGTFTKAEKKKKLLAPHSLNRLKRWHLAKNHLRKSPSRDQQDAPYVIPCQPWISGWTLCIYIYLSEHYQPWDSGRTLFCWTLVWSYSEGSWIAWFLVRELEHVAKPCKTVTLRQDRSSVLVSSSFPLFWSIRRYLKIDPKFHGWSSCFNCFPLNYHSLSLGIAPHLQKMSCSSPPEQVPGTSEAWTLDGLLESIRDVWEQFGAMCIQSPYFSELL